MIEKFNNDNVKDKVQYDVYCIVEIPYTYIYLDLPIVIL